MSVLLETTVGDIVIDLDIDNSPHLCSNLLKLAKARYYSNTLIYNVHHGRFCQLGDPRGDGKGGASIHGLIDAYSNTNASTNGNASVNVEQSSKRFIRSDGNRCLTGKELMEKGRVVATEMGNVENTIGSQFLITIDEGADRALHGIQDTHSNSTNASSYADDNKATSAKKYYSLGRVVEDENDALSKINGLYCDKNGRPYTDVRILQMHILDDPFYDKDPIGMDMLLQKRNIVLMDKDDLPPKYAICANWMSIPPPKSSSQSNNNNIRPAEEIVEERISYTEAIKIDTNNHEIEKQRNEETLKKEDKSNAAILEMLGDIASADMKPPENVLFVCKLNPNTDEEDLTLIFSRFDPSVNVDIVRDSETGDSLQYAFVEFETKEACNEAYFKMNNALIDDRRIKVDFSQSVAKEWNRYTQRKRGGRGGGQGMIYRGNNGDGRNYYNNHRHQQQYLNQPKNEKKYYGGYIQKNRDSNNYQHDKHHNDSDIHHEHQDKRHKRQRSVSPSPSSSSSSNEQRRKHRKRRSRSYSSRDRSHDDSNDDDNDNRSIDSSRHDTLVVIRIRIKNIKTGEEKAKK